jgi:hypothetical protein
MSGWRAGRRSEACRPTALDRCWFWLLQLNRALREGFDALLCRCRASSWTPGWHSLDMLALAFPLALPHRDQLLSCVPDAPLLPACLDSSCTPAVQRHWSLPLPLAHGGRCQRPAGNRQLGVPVRAARGACPWGTRPPTWQQGSAAGSWEAAVELFRASVSQQQPSALSKLLPPLGAVLVKCLLAFFTVFTHPAAHSSAASPCTPRATCCCNTMWPLMRQGTASILR